jgi:membrane-associated phospholipid phosphatase
MTAAGWTGIAVLLVLAAGSYLLGLDQTIARAMADMGPDTIRIARFVTWFGQGGVVLWPSGLIVLTALLLKKLLPSWPLRLQRLVHRAGLIFASVGLAGLADDVLKVVFGRARPFLWLEGDMSGFRFFRYSAKFASFPSGHTTTSVAAAFAFSILFPRYKWAFITFAFMIAFSRIVLEAHYVSDILAGAALGATVAALVVGWLLEYWRLRDESAHGS